MDWNTVEFASMPAIQEMPINSAICNPAPGATVVADGDGDVVVKGWAVAGGGRRVARVDVSADGGATWVVANLDAEPPDASPSLSHSWGWTLWSAVVPVPALRTPGATTPLELVVRAIDMGYNTQPVSADNVWNYRGLLNNTFHRVSATGVAAAATTAAGGTEAAPSPLKLA